MQRLLVALDFDAAADRLLTVARELARATGAATHFVHVATPDPDFVGYDAGPVSVRNHVASELRSEHRWLDDRVERFQEEGLTATCHLLRGEVVDAILREAELRQCDTIVVGTHGRGRLLEALVGSVSHELLQRAECTVVIVPPPKRV
ncbi:MAG: universal stress protein [Planctomycetes bacterium]|nr:universal stress protein [Planctomycetota bacterium]